MYVDSTNLFSDAQAITVDARSTNQIDLGPQSTLWNGASLTREVGIGRPLHVFAVVDETFATTVSMSFVLRCDNDTAFGSPRILWTSRLFLVAELVAGAKLDLPDVPPGTDERYLELYYDVNTTATAGKITSGIVLDLQRPGI